MGAANHFCLEYMIGTGCGWTDDYNCPGEKSGAVGTATEDQSIGFNCCCARGFFSASADQVKQAQQSRTGEALAHVLRRDGYGGVISGDFPLSRKKDADGDKDKKEDKKEDNAK